MTINSDLFLAILSLDSYNRDYGANIALTGTSIGNVSIVTRQSLNISAAAYQNWGVTVTLAITPLLFYDVW
jgi:hypothetical protein